MMLWLILAILFYTAIFVSFKLYEKYNVNNFTAIVINYLIASLTGLLAFSGFDKISDIIHAPWIGIAVIIGVLFVVVFLSLCNLFTKIKRYHDCNVK